MKLRYYPIGILLLLSIFTLTAATPQAVSTSAQPMVYHPPNLAELLGARPIQNEYGGTIRMLSQPAQILNQTRRVTFDPSQGPNGPSNATVASATFGGASVNLGDTTVEANTVTATLNYVVAWCKFTTTTTYTVTSISLYQVSSGGSNGVHFGFYGDSGGNPSGQALVTGSDTGQLILSTSTSWIVYTYGTPFNLPPGTYWLGAIFSATITNFVKQGSTSGAAYYHTQTYGALPSTFPAGATSAPGPASLYATTSANVNPPYVQWINPSNVKYLDGNYTTATSQWHYECPAGWVGTCSTGSFTSSTTEANATNHMLSFTISTTTTVQPTTWDINSVNIVSGSASATAWYFGLWDGTAGLLIYKTGPFVTTSTGTYTFTVPWVNLGSVDNAGAYIVSFTRNVTATPYKASTSGACEQVNTVNSYSDWTNLAGSISTSCGATRWMDGIFVNADYNWSGILQTSGYGFTISTTNIITGIVATITEYSAYNSGDDYVIDKAVCLSRFANYTAIGTCKTAASNWPTSIVGIPYGSAMDNWNYGLTPTIVNNGNFELTVMVLINSGASNYQNTAYVDSMQLTVYYIACPYPNPSSPAYLSYNSTQVNWSGTFSTVATGTMACTPEQAATSDGTNFFATAYYDSSNILKVTYSWLTSSQVFTSATITIRAAAQWNQLGFFTISNVQKSGSTYYLGVASYTEVESNATTTYVQWTSISYTYASNIPTAVVGSTYTAAITDSGVSKWQGPLSAFLDSSGYAWVLMSTSNNRAGIYYCVQAFKGSTTNFTGSGLASSSYVSYNKAYPVLLTYAQTGTTLYAALSSVLYGYDTSDAPAIYRVATSLTVPYISGLPNAGSPAQLWADPVLNVLYMTYENTPGLAGGNNVEWFTYNEATSSSVGTGYHSPTVDRTVNSWLDATLTGGSNGAYLLTILASNQQPYYYYTTNNGVNLLGPYTAPTYTPAGGTLQLPRRIDTGPVLTAATTTSLGAALLYEQEGTPAAIVAVFANFIPNYIQFTGTVTKTALSVTTISQIVSAASTFTNLLNTSTATSNVQNYIYVAVPPVVTYSIAELIILGPALLVMYVDRARSIVGLLLGLMLGVLLGVVTQIVPWWLLGLDILAMIIALFLRRRSGGEME
jgi:hypothetical protein